MQFALANLELPARIRLEHPLTDEELMRFCAANEMVRVERDANGELIVISPSGSGTGQKNSEMNFQLAAWARETNFGVTFDSNAGFTLPDGSMRSPDAAWIAWPRWNALTKQEQDGFAPICPEFVIELRSPSDRVEVAKPMPPGIQDALVKDFPNIASLRYWVEAEFRAGRLPLKL
jgi:Uma2 family endonuclease